MAKNKGVIWNAKAVDAALDRLPLALDAGAEYLRGQIVRNISKPCRVLGHSLPGEFPHAETGRLRQSIFKFEIDKYARGVGTNVEYGLLHETGDRPFMRPTLILEQHNIAKLIRNVAGGKIKIEIQDAGEPGGDAYDMD